MRRSFQFSLLPAVLILVLGFAGCSAKTSKPPRPLTVQEVRGREIFAANCAVCHNAYKQEPLQGPPLVGMFSRQALPSGLPATDEHVRTTILSGRRNMPPFNGVLDDKQIDDVMAFLHTL
ncbi:MAG TPA: cytochrome c [Terriglobales bacterium]|nr:cytochrome c [Terriglobales bacterium]